MRIYIYILILLFVLLYISYVIYEYITRVIIYPEDIPDVK